MIEKKFECFKREENKNTLKFLSWNKTLKKNEQKGGVILELDKKGHPKKRYRIKD